MSIQDPHAHATTPRRPTLRGAFVMQGVAMANRTHRAPDVTHLCQELEHTLAHIDQALDQRNQRAFRAWSGKWKTVSNQITGTLLAIATTETR